MKNTVVKWLLIVFTIANLVDIVTALFSRSAEANPLFLLTGSFIPLFIGKIIVVGGVWWLSTRKEFPSYFIYHFFISVMLLGNLLMILGAMSNIYGILHPSLVEASGSLSTSEKLNGYMWFAMMIYMIPLIFSSVSFKLFEISKKYVKVRK